MGRVKALLPWDGGTFVGRLIGLLRRHCDDVTVVVGVHGLEIQESGALTGADRVLWNERPEQGPFSSLQLALGGAGEACVFGPVDCPAASDTTLGAMVAWLRQGGTGFLVPRHAGKKGHPVACGPEGTRLLRSADPQENAKTVMQANPDLVSYLDVEDPGVLADIDTAADYAALLESQ